MGCLTPKILFWGLLTPTLVAVVLTPFVAHSVSIDFPICLHEGEILPVLKAQQKPKQTKNTTAKVYYFSRRILKTEKC